MKKILSLLLLAVVTGALSAQAAGTEPKESKDIVVQGSSASPNTVKTTVTRKPYTQTVTVPETVTTIESGNKQLERESLLTWLSIGARLSADYHLTPKDGSLSCLWLYSELYNTAWGIQAGVGYMWMPITTYTDNIGTVYNATSGATGSYRNYINLDLLGKYYLWFARVWWVGAGVNYAALLAGQLKWYPTGATNGGTNPADATQPTAYQRTTDIAAGGGLFYVQFGTGLKINIGNGFNTLNFEPEFRVLVPLNSVTGYGTILRFNLGLSYAFNL